MEHPVQVTDWMPTFVTLAGAEAAEGPRYDGLNIWPLLSGEGTGPDVCRLFWNFRGDRHLAARVGDWKLISREVNGSPEHELFDIGSDPYEENDLAGDHPDKVKELSELIVAERQQDGSSARDDVSSPMVA